eukprot:CAMPEP_0116877482 /NCGR_PEP_ID=MMETSP0463-20121206/9263_1 /TAXON_ID=181622 /ORGANISM="Strombidinopsis sp, Strain SopsisLIS2011" /LENGTH=62 /DNA_ID=CAMNT_0004524809 /DNA_START=1481 /DNA_END=1669 /DNA_ORIENTATION=+
MNFSPSDNFIHRRILYEITGRKIQENDQFSDDDQEKYADDYYGEENDEYYDESGSRSRALSG